MNYTPPRPLTGRGPTAPQPLPWRAGETTRRTTRTHLPLARRYELSWCDPMGMVQERVVIAPAIPLFEAATSAFTHGVLIQTTDGEVAVEDLVPGMTLVCGNGSETTLAWKGAITLVPGAPTDGDVPMRLFRVTPDAFGPARPNRDLVLGPSARWLVRSPVARQGCGTEAALQSIADAVDGVSVVEVHPARPTRVYHLLADGHATILANGLEVETYHPGAHPFAGLSHELQKMFWTIFPHIDSQTGFGRMLWPHVSEDRAVPA